ncbi:hypothetical protein GH714_035424 [Hevea brasiliensis]|uniref:Uncharacterized protein n=1 Tax=Hevea brasiliensis TaxID=3981 RepID=A0A6A6L782_HEVBR|nr:hypothetical protein GH714_035424 [Hevea brasiliensis]
MIPKDIKDLIKNDRVPGVLKKPLSMSTYKDYFAALLYAEDFYIEGVIYRVVRSTTVLVEFSEDFYAQHSSRRYDVSFSFNRVCLKRAHQAVEAASDPLFKSYIFPDCDLRRRHPASSTAYFNYKLDADQTSAVRQILAFQGPPPYLIEGPLCELQKYRVILSTYVSSFRLHNEGIAAGHFSHIFLVDASSATEPEAMVALANLANEKTAVIVTGAPGNRSASSDVFVFAWDAGYKKVIVEIDNLAACNVIMGQMMPLNYAGALLHAIRQLLRRDLGVQFIMFTEKPIVVQNDWRPGLISLLWNWNCLA